MSFLKQALLVLLLCCCIAKPAQTAALKQFVNSAQGYSLSIPASSHIDQSFPTVRDVFSTEDLVIEVYFDDLSKQRANFDDYIYYGNKMLSLSERHNLTADHAETVNGYSAHTTVWQRQKLSKLSKDRNYYQSTAIRRNSQEIVTLLFKSTQPIDAQPYLQSFQLLPQTAKLKSIRKFGKSKTLMNAATKAKFEELFGNKAPLTWGIFEPNAVSSFFHLEQKEAQLDHKFKVALRYQSIGNLVPLFLLEQAEQQGRILELTLSTTYAANPDALKAGGRDPNLTIAYDILDGKFDNYLEFYAQQLKGFDKPILFRLNNEMNGDWCWYSAFYTARDSDIYKQLWVYLHDFFSKRQVQNLIWVWNPHDKSFPEFAWNHAFAYYPGDEYVDVVGMTGYNTGNYFAGESWREFKEIYDPLYAEYCANFDKPFIIGEFASASYGGNKAAWISAMFKNIKDYPRIKVAVWWSGIDRDSNGIPGRIYLINDTPATVAAMKQGLKAYN